MSCTFAALIFLRKKIRNSQTFSFSQISFIFTQSGINRRTKVVSLVSCFAVNGNICLYASRPYISDWIIVHVKPEGVNASCVVLNILNIFLFRSMKKNDVDCIRQVCFFVKIQIMFNTRLWCRLFQFIHCVVWKMFKYFVHCTPELCKVQTEMQIQQYFRGIMEFNMVPTINFLIFLLPCQFKFYNALWTSYWQIILNLVMLNLVSFP